MRKKKLNQNYNFKINKTFVENIKNSENDLINDLIKQTDYFKLYENDEDIFEHYKTIENEKKHNKNNKNKKTNSLKKNENKFKFSNLGENIIKNKNKNFLFNNYIRKNNPTLINYCKKAIFNLRKDLPNYKEIINKINNEFDIKNYSTIIENNINNSNIKNISYAETTTPTEINNLLNIKNKSKNSFNVNNLSISSSSEKDDKNNLPPITNKTSIRKSIFLDQNEEQLKLQKIKAKRKNVLFSAIKYLAYNGLTLENFIYFKVLPQKPYELKDSEEFLEDVKYNNIEKVKGAIKKDKNYLVQYDYQRQTGFHWAAKLGYDEMLKIMLQNSKACNLYDYKMRTPIYLAALFNQKNCIKVLLENNGNARICDLNGKKPIDVCTNEKCKELLSTFVEDNTLWKKINGIKKKNEKNTKGK